ncbi:MAG: type IV pilus assembly protein PilM [Jatrophihabitantaceae bacterium]
MKHRQVSINKVGVINTDGHAIGLDIGATSVRAAILSPGYLDGRPSVTIHGVGKVDLPPGTVVNGVVLEQGALTAALKHLWQEKKFECRNVILGIANQQVLVRDLTVPHLDAGQQAKALPYQAREVVALPMDEVVLDFSPLGPPDPETNMTHGLLLAAPREPVLAAVQAVEKAGLRVARVDLASFAVMRAIADEHLAVEAIIDLGAHLTTIVIHDHGVPRLVRTLARGGQEITEQMADRMSISPVEAEALKRDAGLRGHRDDVTNTLVEGLRPLIAEIRTSISYYRSTGAGGPIERVALTGGGSLLGGIAETLSDQLGMSVVVIDPLQHIRNRHHAVRTIEIGEGDDLPSAVSLGLAMGAAA